MLEDLENSKTFMWLTATAVAAVGMLFFISSYVYSRQEGVNLEKRVGRVEKRSKEGDNEIKDSLVVINGKLDKLIKRK